MSNRQARREQSRSSRSAQRSRPTRSQGRPSGGGGGGGMNIFTPGFLIAGGVVIVALIALFILITQVFGDSNGAADQELVDNLTAAEASFPTELADGSTVGNPDAPVKIVEYEDIQCPFCLRYTANVEPQLIDEFVKTGQVQITYKHLPILGNESTLGAFGMTCAAEQGKFWEYHNKLFTVEAENGQASNEQKNVGRFTRDKLRGYAQEVGIDTGQWNACLDDAKTLDTVTNDAREASSFGIQSTPGFVVNGSPIGTGAPTIEEWRDIVKQAQEQANPTSTSTATSSPEGTTTPTTPTPAATATSSN